MRISALSLLGAGLIAGTASAQATGAGPGVITPDTDSKVFSITALSNLTNFYITGATRQYLAQCSARVKRGAGSGPGVYNWCMTVYGLHPQYGNSSQLTNQDFVLTGTFDEVNGKYTPDKLSNAMNAAAGGNFGLMISDGAQRHGVVDWSAGPVYAQRASFAVAFPVPKPIGGITAQYVDPAIEETPTGLVLYYVDSANNRIVKQKLTVTAGVASVTGQATPVADPVRSSQTLAVTCHSPTPQGDLGLWLSERVGSDSDQYICVSNDPADKILLAVDNGRWLNNGAIAGGRMYYANSGANGGFYAAIHYIDAAWMMLPTSTLGGGAKTGIVSVRDQNNGPNLVVSFLAPAGLIPGVAIPGINGKLGINPAGLITWQVSTITNAFERGTVNFPPVPNDNSLKGKYNFQGLAVDPKTGGADLTFTNTAVWNVK